MRLALTVLPVIDFDSEIQVFTADLLIPATERFPQAGSTMQCHNVFHISKLRPCNAENTQPDYIPVSVEKERQEDIVGKIIEHDVATARDGFYERGPCPQRYT